MFYHKLAKNTKERNTKMMILKLMDCGIQRLDDAIFIQILYSDVCFAMAKQFLGENPPLPH